MCASRTASARYNLKNATNPYRPAPILRVCRRHPNRIFKDGGADEIRTHDLCSAIAALSQLSYSPGARERRHLVFAPPLCQAARLVAGAGFDEFGIASPMDLFSKILSLAIAWAFEMIFGYPVPVYARIGHPVIWMGALISVLDRHLNFDED